MAYTPEDIPFAYRAKLEQIRYSKQIPMSWLAALCERTLWNPAFKTTNADVGVSITKQIGLAGIYLDYEAVIVPSPLSDQCRGGWKATEPWIGGGRRGCQTCSPIQIVPESTLMDPLQNLDYAATILMDCRDNMVSLCGEVNAAIYLRYMLGCNYFPPKDASGKCVIPSDMYAPVKAEVATLIELQRLWAGGLGEQPIVPNVMCWNGSPPSNGMCPVCWDGSTVQPGVNCPPNPNGEGGIPWWVWVGLAGIGIAVVVAGSKDDKDQYGEYGKYGKYGQYASAYGGKSASPSRY